MDKDSGKHYLRSAGLMAQFGVTVLVCIALSLFLGSALDRWLDTAPVFVVIFFFLGCGAAIKALVDLAKKV